MQKKITNENLKPYMAQSNFCTALNLRENKKYYERLHLTNVTHGMIRRRSGKLLKHFCRMRLQIFRKCH